MQLFGVERALESAEVSEWLDWMRRELPAARMEVPPEETAVLFAVNAVRFAERVRYLFHHFPAEIRSQVVQAAILRQCWQRQRKLGEKVKGLPASQNRGLSMIEVSRYVRGPAEQGRYLLEGRDGFCYLCLPSPERPMARATHMICAEIARCIGLPTPVSLALSVSQKVHNDFVTLPGSGRSCPGPGNKRLCLGVRCTESECARVSAEKPAPCKSGWKYEIGSLVFDIFTLNSAPEPARLYWGDGRVQCVVFNQSHCLMNANWGKFLSSSYAEPVAPQWAAGRIRSFEQLSRWLDRIDDLDIHRLWELAFQLPPEWYDDDRIRLTRILDKIEERRWQLRRTIEHLINIGYFPNLKKPCESAADTMAERHTRTRVSAPHLQS